MSLFERLRRRLRPERPETPARPVRVVTDSTADLPPELVRELDITVVPLRVIFDEKSYRDGVDLTNEEFFRRLRETKELPRTSQPSTGEFLDVYQRLSGETNRILSIHLSSGFSGTVETARRAAQELIGRCTIEVVDSQTVSMALGFAVIAAAKAARDGHDLEACAAAARSVLRRQRLAVALDTLEYLRRGGRIGRAQAFLGGLLKLKPILTVKEGEAFPVTRVRSRAKAMEELYALCTSHEGVSDIAVLHTTTPDDAAAIARRAREAVPGATIYEGRFGPVLGVHGGPGMLGICVVADR